MLYLITTVFKMNLKKLKKSKTRWKVFHINNGSQTNEQNRYLLITANVNCNIKLRKSIHYLSTPSSYINCILLTSFHVIITCYSSYQSCCPKQYELTCIYSFAKYLSTDRKILLELISQSLVANHIRCNLQHLEH